MDVSVNELIKEVIRKEELSISVVAGKLDKEPWRVERMLQDDKDIRSLSWIEIADAVGYELHMVPNIPGKETVVLDADKNTPLKVLNRILLFSEVKRADIIQELGISRQAMSQLLRKNTDILANRFVQIAGIIGYDVQMVKAELKVVK